MFLQALVKTAKDLNVWVRERIPLLAKAHACLAVLAGSSLAEVKHHLSWQGIHVSRQAIGQWVQQWQSITDWIDTVPKRRRKIIAIDETKIKVNGKTAFFWAAIDVKTRELVAIEVSWQRNGAIAKWFIQDILKKCTNKPKIISDGAGWYPWACRHIGVEHERVRGGQRNYIERFYKTFKQWAKKFNKNFIVRFNDNLEKVKEKISLWCGMFYNWIRQHQTLGCPPALT
jgi:transposase-like protein